ncbi:MAG: hypothetical protein DI598_02575 [Pseudopedobacter saltans]|uniref:Uncharacterized protein n=1 Tax=Pseudopedobacter saltans TaxID=151895 RepID=A0A2W5F9Y9_9SPHI|nr:MAG: hypothetical protein DI598_02575 [Pseudopedobacter saltans]
MKKVLIIETMTSKTPVILLISIISLTACRNSQTNDNLPTNTANKDSLLAATLPKPTVSNTEQKVREDYNNKKLKYYFQSIHYPSAKFIQYMKDSLQIKVVSASDRINLEYAQYNQAVNDIIKTEKGIIIDSILNNKQVFLSQISIDVYLPDEAFTRSKDYFHGYA